MTRRIGYIDPFNGGKSAELETMQRLKYCFEKQGCEFLVLKRDSCDVATGSHADVLNLDFAYLTAANEALAYPMPDTLSCLFHWVPSGFFGHHQFDYYFKYMNKVDAVIGGYESDDLIADCINSGMYEGKMLNLVSSISEDFAIPPVKREKYRLFYVGINIESAFGDTRYGDLFRCLDANDLVDIYGPQVVFGYADCWKGFRNYKGEIPFDGHSVIQKLGEAGVCLALNSPVHSAVGSVSNRIFEGAAAGTVIISDENAFVRNYFGDSVFYIDVHQDSDVQIKAIKDILDYINTHPQVAYDMACRSHRVFLENFSLDNGIKSLLSFVDEKKRVMSDPDKQKERITIICQLETERDWSIVSKEIMKQYHQNIHLVLVCSEKVIKKIGPALKYSYDFVASERRFLGRSFVNAIKHIQGNYFMFLDKHGAMHKNHISKLINTFKGRDILCAYSGTYIREQTTSGEIKSYHPLNFHPIPSRVSLSFSNPDLWQESLSYEEKFSLNCCLFNRKILDIVDEQELGQVQKAVHIYLALSSHIKARKLARFSYNISSGYQLEEGLDFKKEVFPQRAIFFEHTRFGQIYIREMIGIFFKYDFESPETPIPGPPLPPPPSLPPSLDLESPETPIPGPPLPSPLSLPLSLADTILHKVAGRMPLPLRKWIRSRH